MRKKPLMAEDFKAQLVPGEPIDKETVKQKIQGTGKADGVIYLTERRNEVGETIARGLEREAFRYLKGHSLEWQALHPGRRGRCRPDFYQLMQTARNIAVGTEMFKLSRKLVQGLEATFLMTEHESIDRAVDAVQPEHLNKWLILPTDVAGIWAVFYVEEDDQDENAVEGSAGPVVPPDSNRVDIPVAAGVSDKAEG